MVQKKSITVKCVVTHNHPHFDEICALWLAKRFGSDMFIGIENAPLWCTDNNAEIVQTKGVLALGVGGGSFDEHPKPHSGRKTNECTTTLMAGFLDLDTEDENLAKIINFARNADLRASGGILDLPQVIKALHARGKDLEEIIAWTFRGLDAKLDDPNESGNLSLEYISMLIGELNSKDDREVAYGWFKFGMDAVIEDQNDFFTETHREFHNNAEPERIQGPNGRELVLVTIQSDNSQIAKIARSKKHGIDADIVIQRTSSGNVSIFTNQKHGLVRLDVVARMLNFEEQKLSGKITITNWDILSSEGMIENGRWFYHLQGQFLLNGTRDAYVEPTAIPLERIVEIVKIAMDPINEMRKYCDTKHCTSQPKHPCTLYAYGLGSCRKARYDSKYAK